MSIVKGLFLFIFASVIGGAIYFSSKNPSNSISLINKTVVLKGIVTPEKENFLRDERVKAIFEKNGFDVQLTRVSAGKIAEAKTLADLDNPDFVFPNGIQTSEKLKANFKSSQAYNVFYSPMVIATWNPIFDILKSNGLISNNGSYDALNMEKFIKVSGDGVRWKDLKSSDAYPVNKIVLISSSDSRFSNSAKMYLALNSYVLNNSNVVSTNTDVDNIMPTLKKIIQSQGNRETSSTNLVSDYMSIGRGKVPMMFAYESEFLENVFKMNSVNKDIKMLYPTPTIFTKHVMVVMNPNAQPLVDLFKKNDELKKIALDYGFRFEGETGLVQKAKSIGIDIPETVIDVIDPPSYDVLDYMAESVEKK